LKTGNIPYNHFGQYQCLEDIKNDSVDLGLYTCGMEACAPLHSFGPGVRSQYIFHFILEGYGYVEHEGNVTKLGPNDVFLIWPGQTTHYWADAEQPWHYMWIGFCGIKAPSYIHYAGYDQNHLTGSFENCLLIKPYIQQIITCRTYTHANDLKRNAALMEILALLIDYAKETPDYSRSLPKQEYVEKARNLIEMNYDGNITVSELAAKIGIDRSYFSRIFKEVLSMSPQEYIKQFRLHKAALLLQDPLMKVSAVARAVGYQDYITFTKLFKQYKGVTPTEYRRQLLENAKKPNSNPCHREEVML